MITTQSTTMWPKRATKIRHYDLLRPRVGQKEPPRLGSTICYGQELSIKSHQDSAVRFVTAKSWPERATKTRQYDLLRPRVGQKEPPRLGSTICYGQELARKSHQDSAVRFVTAKSWPERATKTRQYDWAGQGGRGQGGRGGRGAGAGGGAGGHGGREQGGRGSRKLVGKFVEIRGQGGKFVGKAGNSWARRKIRGQGGKFVGRRKSRRQGGKFVGEFVGGGKKFVGKAENSWVRRAPNLAHEFSTLPTNFPPCPRIFPPCPRICRLAHEFSALPTNFPALPTNFPALPTNFISI